MSSADALQPNPRPATPTLRSVEAALPASAGAFSGGGLTIGVGRQPVADGFACVERTGVAEALPDRATSRFLRRSRSSVGRSSFDFCVTVAFHVLSPQADRVTHYAERARM
jgi:hypothetical protein